MGSSLRHIFWCLLCGLGTVLLSCAQRSYAQNATAPASHALGTASWSFECIQGSICGSRGNWINTTSQPGTVRLWNAGTSWADLETASGTYNWTLLDTWLDMLAGHQPITVLYTFGDTPCFIASTACAGSSSSPSPPADLTPSGSPTFTAFVTTLTQHCSAAGNCVKDYIKVWEMWNEANLTAYWTGTTQQLYQMFAPVIPIIRANIPKAAVSTPPVCGGKATWMAGWMAQENTNGRLSDYYGIHLYLNGYEPEQRMPMIAKMVATKNSNGWTTTPWINSETNYDNATFACSTQYTVEDCEGQLVRWHVLLFAYQGGVGGASLVGWFNWPSLSKGSYDTYYYTMMQWLVGSTFTTSCTNSGPVWTCPLTEPAGGSALIVWNTAGASSYTPAPQYVDYREFNGTYGGAIIPIAAGQTTTIGLIPVMFETTKLHLANF